MHLAPLDQIPPVYHRRIGEIIVTCVSDGYLEGGLNSLQNIDLSEAQEILNKSLRPIRRASVNCFLIHSDGHLALIDTGCGTYLKPTAGHLLKNLAAAGISPSDIDAILLTHIHPDHSAGLTDRMDGTRLFPNAELVVHQNELIHWFDDEHMSKAGEDERKYFFECAREQVGPYLDVTKTFNEQTEVFPGVKSIPLLGHTPGHSGFLISSGAESLLIWGDLIHVQEIQIQRPEVTMSFDYDAVVAEETRRKTLAEVAKNKNLIAGAHFDFPGLAQIIRYEESFKFMPEEWIYTLSEQ